MLNKSCLPLVDCELKNECDNHRKPKAQINFLPLSGGFTCKHYVRKPTALPQEWPNAMDMAGCLE